MPTAKPSAEPDGKVKRPNTSNVPTFTKPDF
jgi:hypothetical protein